MGASGAGTSTLGRELAKVLPHVHLDSDDYFWEHKYSKQTDVADRLRRVKQDIHSMEPWILSGAVCGWGDELRPFFDLIIYLWVPPEIRLERLRVREFERYGADILPDGSKYEDMQTFLEWAALYDVAGVEVRSKVLHEEWMSVLECPVIRMEGDLTTIERVETVLSYMS